MSDLKIIEDLKIAHCLKEQDIRYSSFKLYNSSSSLVYKNILLKAKSLIENKISFKLSLSNIDTDSEWENFTNELFIPQLNPGSFIEIKIRSVVNDTDANPGIYDCKFETSYTLQGV